MLDTTRSNKGVFPPVSKTQEIDPFISQLANADNSYIYKSNGQCQFCEREDRKCPYCKDIDLQ